MPSEVPGLCFGRVHGCMWGVRLDSQRRSEQTLKWRTISASHMGKGDSRQMSLNLGSRVRGNGVQPDFARERQS